jgi:thiamine-monophosphate kinase
MPEFDLIERLRARICTPAAAHSGECLVGIGDDAAVLAPPPNRQLVVCTDTLVEGVHFPIGTAADSVGHKALAVNLSDLAAMGAEPAWFFLALTLPAADSEWLDRFAAGMARLASATGIYLAGGDLASGPLNICVTAVGLVETGRALQRSGAAPGDLVVVSGRPGAAAHALDIMRAGGEPAEQDRAALDFPSPRLELGRALQGLATSCIDLSDGLLADLGHILDASKVGAELALGSLPCPDSMAAKPELERWPSQLSGGDDYELCFTVPAASRGRLDALARSGACELTVIGAITAERGLKLSKPGGGIYRPGRPGYEHFSDDQAGAR